MVYGVSRGTVYEMARRGEVDVLEVGRLKKAERHLIDACSANGLTADDGLPGVIATIRSAFNGAAAKPRRGLA